MYIFDIFKLKKKSNKTKQKWAGYKAGRQYVGEVGESAHFQGRGRGNKPVTTSLMSKTGFYAKVVLEMVCSSWLFLLLWKCHQMQGVFDYLFKGVGHTVHAEQRLWHLGHILIQLQIHCWLLTLADKALCSWGPDYNGQVWSDSGTHLPERFLE